MYNLFGYTFYSLRDLIIKSNKLYIDYIEKKIKSICENYT